MQAIVLQQLNKRLAKPRPHMTSEEPLMTSQGQLLMIEGPLLMSQRPLMVSGALVHVEVLLMMSKDPSFVRTKLTNYPNPNYDLKTWTYIFPSSHPQIPSFHSYFPHHFKLSSHFYSFDFSHILFVTIVSCNIHSAILKSGYLDQQIP